MKLISQLQQTSRFFLALTVAMVLSLPLLEQTHTHPADQIQTTDCEICLQLSTGDELSTSDLASTVPAISVEFVSYQSENAAFGLLQRQRARAPPVS